MSTDSEFQPFHARMIITFFTFKTFSNVYIQRIDRAKDRAKRGE